MKILSLTISGFGCHRDQNWEFDPGLNLVVGPNEAGKTTLLRCMLGMLYPLTRRRGGATPEVDLWAPWTGGAYAAALTLETDDGRRLEVRKTFTRDKEKVSIVDAQRGEVTGEFLEGPDGKDRDVGLSLFNLVRDEFQHTAYIRYGELSWAGYRNGRGQLAKRLEQMVDARSGASAAEALQVLKNTADEVGSDRSSKRPLDVATRELAQLRLRIAEAETKYVELAEREAERERQAAELAGLERRIALEEFLELGDTERELVARIDKARALAEEIRQISERIKELGPAAADDLGKPREELTRCRAVRKEHEKDLAARTQQFRLTILERIEACQERLSQRYEKFLALPEPELSRLEEEARRWQDWSARRAEIARSLAEEEQRAGANGLFELQEINLRLLRAPDKAELIETGKERLSELENTLIVKNQELRDLESRRMVAQGNVSRLWTYGGVSAAAAVISLLLSGGDQRGYIVLAAALAVAAIVLGTWALLRRGTVAAQFTAPLAELEAALSSLRSEREGLFRQLEEAAVALDFPSYKDCRAALEKVRRNQMRVGGLQHLQHSQRQVESDLAALEAGLRDWAARLEIPLPAGDFSSAHAKALSGAVVDYRADLRQLEDLRQEQKKHAQELAEQQARIGELEAAERRVLATLKLPAEDLEAGWVAFQELDRRHAAWNELSLAREKAQAMLESVCRGKKPPQLESDLAGVRRRRQELAAAYADLPDAAVQAGRQRADEPERARMKNRQRELRDQIRAAEVWASTQRENLPSLSELRERQAGLEARIQQLENYRQRLLLAHRVLSEIALQSHRRWSEELTEEVGPMLSRLTLGRYEKVIIDPELQLHLSPLPDRTLSPDEVERSLSSGTLDQLYLCLRVAVAGLISPRERLPLLLDDPMLTFDESRRKAALTWLGELAQQRQVFLFSCNPTYASHLPEGTRTLQLATPPDYVS